jgi:hypothetical protein
MPGLIVITNVPPYSGANGPPLELSLDTTQLSNRDWHTIKEISGIRPAEMEAATEAQDNDLIVALAVCALRKHGHPIAMPPIWDAPHGNILYLAEQFVDAYHEGGFDAVVAQIQADGALPPTAPPTNGGELREPSEQPLTSGASSSTGGEASDENQASTGIPASDTGVGFGLETSPT